MLRRMVVTEKGGWWEAPGVFVTVAAALIWYQGNAVVFTNDEGILLDAAQRMLRGNRLYVDFFGIVSPGSYWLHELALWLFGTTLRAGRLIVILDFALQCALLAWLTSRLAARSWAWATLALFIGLQSIHPALLSPSHRWDSAALSLASIALCLQAFWSGRRAWWIAGGVAAAAAAFCTPPVGLIALVTAGWLLWREELRRFFWSYVAAGACTASVLAGLMYVTGILAGFLRQMAWLRSNYSQVNWMPYGAVIGGYSAPLAGASGGEFAFRSALLLCLAMPAVLPVIAAVGWTGVAVLRRTRGCPLPKHVPIGYLTACLAAYVASTLPRADVTHLAFVAPLGYALVAMLGYWNLRPATARAILLALLPWACSLAAYTSIAGANTAWVESPVGLLRVERSEAGGLRRLLSVVRPGDRLYVHPYMPLFYFLTRSKHCTRFSFLNPGMMTEREELTALGDLRQRPPTWVLHLRVTREEFLRVWPNATKLDHRFRTLDAYLEQNYVPVAPAVVTAGYELWVARAIR